MLTGTHCYELATCALKNSTENTHQDEFWRPICENFPFSPGLVEGFQAGHLKEHCVRRPKRVIVVVFIIVVFEDGPPQPTLVVVVVLLFLFLLLLWLFLLLLWLKMNPLYLTLGQGWPRHRQSFLLF